MNTKNIGRILLVIIMISLFANVCFAADEDPKKDEFEKELNSVSSNDDANTAIAFVWTHVTQEDGVLYRIAEKKLKKGSIKVGGETIESIDDANTLIAVQWTAVYEGGSFRTPVKKTKDIVTAIIGKGKGFLFWFFMAILAIAGLVLLGFYGKNRWKLWKGKTRIAFKRTGKETASKDLKKGAKTGKEKLSDLQHLRDTLEKSFSDDKLEERLKELVKVMAIILTKEKNPPPNKEGWWFTRYLSGSSLEEIKEEHSKRKLVPPILILIKSRFKYLEKMLRIDEGLESVFEGEEERLKLLEKRGNLTPEETNKVDRSIARRESIVSKFKKWIGFIKSQKDGLHQLEGLLYDLNDPKKLKRKIDTKKPSEMRLFFRKIYDEAIEHIREEDSIRKNEIGIYKQIINEIEGRSSGKVEVGLRDPDVSQGPDILDEKKIGARIKKLPEGIREEVVRITEDKNADENKVGELMKELEQGKSDKEIVKFIEDNF